MSVGSKLLTLAIVVVYAVAMVSTNGIFTILDDESTIVSMAGSPVLPTVQLYLHGGSVNEHPPASDILLHGWMVATGYAFAALRIFANIFYILGTLFLALSAYRLAGIRAYWAALVLSFAWPFAFQYGRITGWYCCSFFLVALATWLYLEILDGRGYGWWIAFTAAAILMVWTNYFGVATLLLLLLDLLFFHRDIARKNRTALLLSVAAVVLSFVPFLKVVIENLGVHAMGVHSGVDWKAMVAEVGYPLFSIFGSVAVAPWYLPLSIPVFAATIALLVSIWCSPGRRWLVYLGLSVVLLELSGQTNVKRVLFLLPWLFVAMILAALGKAASYPRLAWAAIVTLVVAGWIGIISGRHYATANLYEPWKNVAQVVAGNARAGDTVISDSFPFFFYMNYQLGLERETQADSGSDLTAGVYQSHGYRILEPDGEEQWLDGLKGKVVLVSGAAYLDEVQWMASLNDRLHQRCNIQGEYRAVPDPALAFKTKFVKDAPALAYRVDVTWFDCSGQGK
jgi:hypothetical protein